MAAIAFPTNPTENQPYEENGRLWLYQSGKWVLAGTEQGNITLALNRYDLALRNTTSAANLNDAQVFKIANAGATSKTLSFSNVPAGRAMTVVLVVRGNAGSILMPAGVEYATGIDNTLGTTRTIFVLFWDGEVFTVTSNVKK